MREREIRFDWDETKERANFRKHEVTFEESTSVFENPLAVLFEDQVHSGTEPREIIVGHSIRNRLLFVCFVEREGWIRLISARPATAREQRDYEESFNR
jgi:uncharacterized DUF497 family protein